MLNSIAGEKKNTNSRMHDSKSPSQFCSDEKENLALTLLTRDENLSQVTAAAWYYALVPACRGGACMHLHVYLLFVWLHALQQEPKLQDVRAKGDSTIRR
jgi:hypothetical protein